MSVGLSAYTPFKPVVKLHGLKNDWITFDEDEWGLLLENQGVIINYLYSNDGNHQIINIGSNTLRFHMIGLTKVVTFVSVFEVCVAYESICELWEFIPLIQCRMRLLKNLKFDQFYENVVKCLVGLPGDFKTHILMVLKELDGCENASCMHEMIKSVPDIIAFDFEHYNL